MQEQEPSNNKNKIPSPPFAYLSADSEFLDLDSLEQVLNETQEQRQQAYDLGNQIKACLLKCRASLEKHQTPEQQKTLRDQLETLVKQALEFHNVHSPDNNNDENNNTDRLGNLTNQFGDYLRHLAYEHFIQTGTLLSPTSPFSDEEYLAGILSFVNFDLKRYVIGRGTHRDAPSVLLARDMVSTLLDHLLQYDFRNGPLRRKYGKECMLELTLFVVCKDSFSCSFCYCTSPSIIDGVKYTLKTCETVLYELSVTGCQEAIQAEATQRRQSSEPPPKRFKGNSGGNKSEIMPLTPSPFMDVHALEALRLRMVEKDELREKLIKKCRDGQKAAKQAIYALHRDDFDGAAQLLDQCEQCILEELEPIVKMDPNLRHGSYANVLEEYAEAKLYQVWLVGKDDSMQEDKGHSAIPAKVVLRNDDFTKIRLEPQEYLGGLCDLTGEIGRYAVKKATIRDKENVKNCLETNMSILYAMESLGKIPGNIGKKIDPLRRTVEKQERMLYELSLVEATGRNTIVAGVEATEEDS